MFTGGNFKSLVAGASLFLALAAQVNAHAIPVPALGVAAPVRNDVKRPSTQDPCGGVNVAQNIDTSVATPAAADGSFTIGVQNFNPGGDGSRSVSVTVDATGTGTASSFVAGTVTKNGDANPNANGVDQVTFTLPAGTTCKGGAAGNLCLVSVKTTAGFGACTVVSQGAAAAAGAGAAASSDTAVVAASTTAVAASSTTQAATGTTNTGSTTGATTGKKGRKGKKGGKKAAAKAAAAKAGAAQTNAAIVKTGGKNKKVTGRFAPALLRRESEEMLH